MLCRPEHQRRIVYDGHRDPLLALRMTQGRALRMTLEGQFYLLMSWIESMSFRAFYRKLALLINSWFFKVYAHTDAILVNGT